MEIITAAEKQLIGLNESDPLPLIGRNFKVFSFSGFSVDSSTSWDDGAGRASVKLHPTLWFEFGVAFHPGSLNVRLAEGIPWHIPENLSARKIRLGVFEVSYGMPVILDEKCIGMVAAVGVRGFDPVTSERVLPPLTVNPPEMYAIFSPVNIRERLGLEDKENSNNVPINARLLPGNLLAKYQPPVA